MRQATTGLCILAMSLLPGTLLAFGESPAEELTPVLDYAIKGAMSITVVENRPFVLSGDKPETCEGIRRNAYGMPFNFSKVRDDRDTPYTKRIEAIVSAGLAKAGATHVVVMSRAHEETLKCVVKAGRDFGVKVMGDNLGEPDMVAGARRIEDLGCDYVIHHIGYDERRGIAASGRRMPSPLDQLRDVVAAVSVPVQAVGGLSLEQAVRTPEYGAPLVVVGAPLAVDAEM